MKIEEKSKQLEDILRNALNKGNSGATVQEILDEMKERLSVMSAVREK